MKDDVIYHYDLLIDEGNDPICDPEPLKEYMDKWDGAEFIEKMNINKDSAILEIGVGTGRLAVRVAPLCKKFFGVDISPKTVERAKENLALFSNIELICDDFMTASFDTGFDVIYSSLTFMHIEEKQKAFDRVKELLKPAGRFLLSIDKNQSDFIDMTTRKIKIYPDNREQTVEYIKKAGLSLSEAYETEFAHIFVCTKDER